MKVILRKDIPKVGKRGEVREVNDGYARNFLFPHGFAEMATPEALSSLEKIKKVALIEKEIQHDLLRKNLKELEGVTVKIVRPANEKGHLFSSIHREDILLALKKDHHIEMASESLVMERPLKELGVFTLNVETAGQKATFTVLVEQGK